jgi:hypothetical protein
MIIALLLLSASIGFGPLTERSASARWAIPNPVVTNLNDSGAGSLRQAISDADPGGAITFQAGLSGAITLGSELTIDKDLTIQGPGANLLTVSGANAVRVFNIPAGNVTLTGLTIANGRVTGGRPSGGGISYTSAGVLTLQQCTLSGNSAFHSAGTVISESLGGGIFNDGGTLNLMACTLSGNSASVSGAGGQNKSYGGGIFNQAGAVNLTACTLSGNSTSASGAELHNSSQGGGIYNLHGTLNLTACTLSGNSAFASGNSYGGGIYGHHTGGTTVKNTIIAGNTAGSGPDVSGVFTSQGYNLIGKTDVFSIGFDAGNPNANQDIVGTSGSPIDPLLGPLAFNNGPTQTRTLLIGSPAIDTGVCAGIPATDQRGVSRPQGPACDIGAYEKAAAFNFSGFFAPVDNPPLVNVARAGAAIPVKFSLGGDQGLGIFAMGYPTSQQIGCSDAAPASDVEETVTAGASSLSYDPTTEQYTYVWKTNAAWRNTCRRLTIKLSDGTLHTANFRFR